MCRRTEGEGERGERRRTSAILKSEAFTGRAVLPQLGNRPFVDPSVKCRRRAEVRAMVRLADALAPGWQITVADAISILSERSCSKNHDRVYLKQAFARSNIIGIERGRDGARRRQRFSV